MKEWEHRRKRELKAKRTRGYVGSGSSGFRRENERMVKLVREWCESDNQWQGEVYPDGLPRVVTRARRYYAGRALFELVGVEPLEGAYSKNHYNERPLVLELLSEELNGRKSHGSEEE
ncbi:hypothetical protein [uncultured Mediterranean phage]|nr:hypothetical protein [uncultured Mediterranean phage]